MKKIKIISVSFILMMVAVLVGSVSYGKYVIEHNVAVAKLEIDRTKPIGTVSYSTQDLTNQNVEVTISLSEKIRKVDGWSLSKDKLSITKIYEQNSTEEVTLVDLSGNENIVEVNVQNIDKDAPEISLVDVQATNIQKEESDNNENGPYTITATIKITDANLNSNADIDISKIDAMVGEEKITCTKVLENLKQSETEMAFDLQLTDIEKDGILILVIANAFISDSIGNSTAETILNTEYNLENFGKNFNKNF